MRTARIAFLVALALALVHLFAHATAPHGCGPEEVAIGAWPGHGLDGFCAAVRDALRSARAWLARKV